MKSLAQYINEAADLEIKSSDINQRLLPNPIVKLLNLVDSFTIKESTDKTTTIIGKKGDESMFSTTLDTSTKPFTMLKFSEFKKGTRKPVYYTKD